MRRQIAISDADLRELRVWAIDLAHSLPDDPMRRATELEAWVLGLRDVDPGVGTVLATGLSGREAVDEQPVGDGLDAVVHWLALAVTSIAGCALIVAAWHFVASLLP